MKFSKQYIQATEEMSGLHRCVAAPYFRKKITIRKPLDSAHFTICGLGFYRFWLNETEHTKGFLSPYIANPDDILDYDSYDLTDKLNIGDNILAFQLGNGMQNAFGGFIWNFDTASFRSAPKMACCLSLRYADGSFEQIEADESFLSYESPILRDDLRMGEIYDANCEIDGWNSIDFDDSNWRPAIKTVAPGGKAVLCKAAPIVKTGEFHPISITEGEWMPGISHSHHYGYIYDFGLNTTGVVKLRIQGRKGQRITMTFGEILKDGKFYTDNISFTSPDLARYPDYVQQDVYICRGGEVEEYIPSFTYHGFRYVFVEGIDADQATEALLTYQVMHTALEEKGGFYCSCDKLNRLQAMTRNATVSNFWHFPTDCPHREKNGWTADAALSAEHTLLNLEPTANYEEWMLHICAALNEEGALPGIVPTSGWGFSWGNGPAWDQIIVELPYLVYQYRGNRTIAENSMDSIYRYVQYLYTRRDDRGLMEIGLGDWCAPKGIKSPLIFTDSVMVMEICKKASFLAKLCGRAEMAAYCDRFANEMRESIRQHLINPETCIAVGECQTSQAMGIAYDVFDESEKVKALEALLRYLKQENYHLDTGVLGGRVIFHVLAEYGYADLAYQIMTDPTPPSYGYWLEEGCTALAEDFSTGESTSASKNHHFWGDISSFFIKDICGIHYNPAMKDHCFAEIKPHFLQALTFAEAFHICPEGEIRVRWERKEAEIRLQITAPETVELAVTLPEGYHGNSIKQKESCKLCLSVSIA